MLAQRHRSAGSETEFVRRSRIPSLTMDDVDRAVGQARSTDKAFDRCLAAWCLPE